MSELAKAGTNAKTLFLKRDSGKPRPSASPTDRNVRLRQALKVRKDLLNAFRDLAAAFRKLR